MRIAPLVVALLALASPARAQDLPGGGPEVFAGLLHFRGVEPASGNRVERGDIVIILDPPPRDRAGQALTRAVLGAGGSALLASDRATDWDDFLPGGSARTTGGKVVAPPAKSWGRVPNRPLVAPNPELRLINFLGNRDPLDELFRNRFRLATDTPSAVVVDEPDAWLSGPFAWFPPGSRFEGGQPLGRGVAAVGSTRRTARLLILADPDILANDLLTAVDPTGLPADNLPFADALVTWLSDGGQRTRCHFYVNGQPVTDFTKVRLDGATPPIPLPDIDPLAPKLQRAMTDLANRALADAEAGGGLDQFLKNRRGSGGAPPKWLQWLAAAAALVAVALLTRRLLGSRPPVSQSKPKPPATDLRPAARDYLAELMSSLGREPVGPPPRLKGRAARTLTPGFRIVWGVASGADGAAVSPKRWGELAGHADALRSALAAGECYFTE